MFIDGLIEEGSPRIDTYFPELLITDAPEISWVDIPFAQDSLSSTYQTTHRNKVVSVKMWRYTVLAQEREKFIRRLERKLRIWWEVTEHPNIDPLSGMIFELDKYPGLGIVTPYYHNGDINQYILKYPHVDRLILLQGVASGLRHLHSLNPPVAHGDVRGCNVSITDDGAPMLCNIGVGHLPTPPDWAILVGSCDSTRWMAPEVMNPSTEYDDDFYATTSMSDVYSFGMLMLEIYTGRVPFSHRRFIGGVILDVVNGNRPPRPSAETCPNLTNEIWDVIESCWSQDPSHRPTMDCVGSWISLISSVQRAEQMSK